MSAIEETKSEISVQKAAAKAGADSYLTRLLNFLSSVRFGVSLLILLASLSMVGMLVMQQNVEGFDKYFAELSPATKALFIRLGFFDIYHAWYFNALLLVLSLNIVLASIDRFPKAWSFVAKPKRDASAHWLRGQEQTASLTLAGAGAGAVAAKVEAAFKGAGLKTTVTEKGGRTFVFGERGVWNRLGAYAVHVALLTIFLGGFFTSQFGFTGNMSMVPGGSSNSIVEREFDLAEPKLRTMTLPFTVECTDIQQKIIKLDGPITADNTLDWMTAVRIKDPQYGEREGLVHLNAPLDFSRGWWWDNYRFFQASFNPAGTARTVKLGVTPDQPGAQTETVTIQRDGSARLADGTVIELVDFMPDFVLNGGKPDTRSPDYNRPGAVLNVVSPSGSKVRGYAFQPEALKEAPMAGRAVGGYKLQLLDFEKVSAEHILSVQRDPGATIVYLGFGMLALTLSAVFFFSHQRVWAHVEEKGKGTYEVVLGGNTNRNKLGFEDRFKKIVAAAGGQTEEVYDS